MLLRQYMLDLPPQEVNVFLMADMTTREALIVDAGALHPQLAADIKKLDLNVTHILVTHLHWDHVDGLGDYLKAWPQAEVVAPAAPELAPGATIIRAGSRVEAAGFEFIVLKTSGHTPESVSYYCPAHALCFVGDAVFAGALGGTTEDALHEELLGHVQSKIIALPTETELYSGHGPVTTVGIEAAANPFLRPGFGRS